MSTTTKRRFVAEDLYKFVTVGDPQISPDGELVAFVRTEIDQESKEPRSAIWVVPADGSRPAVRYTSGKSDSAPRWSPDGRLLAFLRSGATNGNGPSPKQLWLIERAGGEAWQVTTMRNGAGAAVWSPDGTRIAFTSSVRSSESRDVLLKERGEADRKAAEKEKTDKAPVYTKMQWRFDPVGIPPVGMNSHIWYINVPQAGQQASGAVQVTWGEFSHTSPSWSPDGKKIAFTCKRSENEMARFTDVWVTDVPETEDAEKFTPVNVTKEMGFFGDPEFSPDGKYLAVVGHQREYENTTLSRVYLFPTDGGEFRVLNKDWDMGVGAHVNADTRPGGGVGITWAPESNVIYIQSEEKGRAQIWSLQVAGGPPRLICGGDREIYGATFDANMNRMAFVANDFRHPGDVYSLDLNEYEELRLTEVNRDFLAGIELPEFEEISYKGADDWEIHGWLIKPVGFEPGKKYPLVQEIHGGPATCWGCSFHFEMQLLASNGYGVLFVNPRGGTSYGQKFVNAVRHDYCNRDYIDLMKGVDYAIAQGWVDEKRLGVTGGSYGGLMSNWIVTQTDRFAAAITHRSISNWNIFAGVSDIGPWFCDSQHGVKDPWSAEGYQKLYDISPIKYVQNVKTPIQIMHSEQDYRCPISDAEQWFTALKFYGKAPVELIRHPRSNHDLTRSGPPVLRVDRFQQMLRWLTTYMPANAEGAAQA